MIKFTKVIILIFLLASCAITNENNRKSTKQTLKYDFKQRIRKRDILRKNIGVLIDKSYPEEQTKLILKGIRASKKRILKKYQGKFFIIKTSKKSREIFNSIKNLTKKKKVGTLVAWGSRAFLKKIEKYYSKYKRPTLFITKEKFKNKGIYTISPNVDNYSKKLSETMVKKSIKKIAILTPEKYKKTTFLNNIKKHFKSNAIEIVFDEHYVSNDFYSMNKACKKIFSISKKGRRLEYLDILSSETKKALMEGHDVNLKHVFLSAKTDFDAIFIPDNFLNVNYFVKLFEYYKVKGVKLIGTHEWRSKSLLVNKSSLINGSIFVDFIGDYSSLPIMNGVKNNEKTLFVDPKVGLEMDYGLMGFYSGLLSQIVAKKTYHRKAMNKYLSNIELGDHFIGDRKAFKGNAFNWPTFVFEIKNNQFLLNENL